MKKFAAHYLFPGNNSPIKKGIVEVDVSGLILQVITPENEFAEMEGMEFHNGIICPGFVNLFEECSTDEFFTYFPELNDFRSTLVVKPSNNKELWEWIKTLQIQGQSISLEQLICIFTLRSAEIIQREQQLGSIEPGKAPGLMLISQMDYVALRLTTDSKLKKLI